MKDLINAVVRECSEGLGVDLVFKANDHICVVCANDQSRIIDCKTKEVSADTRFWCNPEDIEIIQIEDSKKSILGRKLYTLSNNVHILKMLKVWIDLDLDSFAYSVDYDIPMVDSLIDYVLLQIGRGMNTEIDDYTSYLNCLFELDKEMAVAYCKGYMDVINNRQSECKLQTPEAQKVENLLNTEQFCDKFVNYVCKTNNEVFIFMEESDKSVVLDLETGECKKMKKHMTPHLLGSRVSEVCISSEKYGAARYFLGVYTHFVQNGEFAWLELLHAIMIHRYDLDAYFSSVNYDTGICERLLKYLTEVFDSVTSNHFKTKLDAVSEYSTIKKFFGYTNKKMAMAYIDGCYTAEVM